MSDVVVLPAGLFEQLRECLQVAADEGSLADGCAVSLLEDAWHARGGGWVPWVPMSAFDDAGSAELQAIADALHYHLPESSLTLAAGRVFEGLARDGRP